MLIEGWQCKKIGKTIPYNATKEGILLYSIIFSGISSPTRCRAQLAAVHNRTARKSVPPSSHPGTVAPWPDLSFADALKVVETLGYNTVLFSPFQARSDQLEKLQGHFSRWNEADRPRSSATRHSGGDASRVFPYRFHSIAYKHNFHGEPAPGASALKDLLRAQVAALLLRQREVIDRATFMDDFVVERLSDVAARRKGFLARLGA